MKKLNTNLTNITLVQEEIKAIRTSENQIVLGFDFYKYSELSESAIIVFPLLLHTIIEKVIKITVDENPYLFQKYEEGNDPFAHFIDTGDGGFFILRNPLEAIAFIINFSIYLRVYNSNYEFEDLYDILGELNVRFAITSGNVYQFKKNYYGEAIIKCARILSKDKLNRILMDSETHRWFLKNLIGIENLRNISEDLLEQSQYFQSRKFDIKPYKDEDRFKGNFKDINSCIELKLKQSKEKETNLEIYVVGIESTLPMSEGQEGKVTVHIGNYNTEGL